MGMAKTIKIIFSLAFVVFLAFAATNVEATRYIGYDALRHGDHEFGCSKLHPQFCKKVQANPYRRGCEAIERCHG